MGLANGAAGRTRVCGLAPEGQTPDQSCFSPRARATGRCRARAPCTCPLGVGPAPPLSLRCKQSERATSGRRDAWECRAVRKPSCSVPPDLGMQPVDAGVTCQQQPGAVCAPRIQQCRQQRADRRRDQRGGRKRPRRHFQARRGAWFLQAAAQALLGERRSAE